MLYPETLVRFYKGQKLEWRHLGGNNEKLLGQYRAYSLNRQPYYDEDMQIDREPFYALFGLQCFLGHFGGYSWVHSLPEENKSKLQIAVEHLVRNILEYIDEIWDSKEENVTREEVEDAAAELIYNHLFGRNDVPLIDAADVCLAVETVREQLTPEELGDIAERMRMHEALLKEEN